MTETVAMPPADMLNVLSRCNAERLKAFADPWVAELGDIEVIENRTGLVMLPMRDTAQGTDFHLGEVLMSEAQIDTAGVIGFGMRRGRDREAAMAMAVVDACMALGHEKLRCLEFCCRGSAATGRRRSRNAVSCRSDARRYGDLLTYEPSATLRL